MKQAAREWQAQWLRLRSLRVDRARLALRQTEQAEAAARAVVEERRRRIEQGRDSLAELARDWSASEGLPRWSGAVTQWREALADRLERDEYELIDEERSLEEALDALQRCRDGLVRAMARHEAVGEWVQQERREAGRVRERRAEREQEERCQPSKECP